MLVVLDEAYIEFSDEPSKMKWVAEYSNLVVLRTFSKCAALAGLRQVSLFQFTCAVAGSCGSHLFWIEFRNKIETESGNKTTPSYFLFAGLDTELSHWE